jgi:hypothetical protein
MGFLRKEGLMKGLKVATVLVIMAIPLSAYGTEVWVEEEFSPNGFDVAPGSVVKVSVKIANVEYLYALGFELTYNSAVLEFKYCNSGDIFEGYDTAEAFSGDYGYVSYGITILGKTPGVTIEGEATIATFKFRVYDYGVNESKLCDVHVRLFDGKTVTDNPDFTLLNDTAIFNNLIALNFTYSPEEPLEYEEIYFDASGTKYRCPTKYYKCVVYKKEYLWDFGNGGSGEGINIVWMYDQEGNYTVTLTVRITYQYKSRYGEYYYYVTYEASMEKTLTVYPRKGPLAPVDLVRRSAWPEHHHFDISRDEDGFQRLFGKVKNNADRSYYVKVRFSINGSELVDTEVVELAPGEIKDLFVDWANFTAGKRYKVYARALFSADGNFWLKGKKEKRFGFAVVE